MDSLSKDGDIWVSRPNPGPCDDCKILQGKNIALQRKLHNQTHKMHNMSLTEQIPVLKRQIEFLRGKNYKFEQTIEQSVKKSEDTIESYYKLKKNLDKWSTTLAAQEKKQILVQQELDWKNKMLLKNLDKYQEVIDIVDGISETGILEIEREGYIKQVSWINAKISKKKAAVLDKIATRTKELDATIVETKEAIHQLLSESNLHFWKEGACFSELTSEQKERFWRHQWLFHKYNNNPNDPSLQWDESKDDDLKYTLKTNLLWSDERLRT